MTKTKQVEKLAEYENFHIIRCMYVCMYKYKYNSANVYKLYADGECVCVMWHTLIVDVK